VERVRKIFFGEEGSWRVPAISLGYEVLRVLENGYRVNARKVSRF